ncbi:MAG: hypothetical protein ACRC0V_02610 [Fusobacteriaceae bacterium]
MEISDSCCEENKLLKEATDEIEELIEICLGDGYIKADEYIDLDNNYLESVVGDYGENYNENDYELFETKEECEMLEESKSCEEKNIKIFEAFDSFKIIEKYILQNEIDEDVWGSLKYLEEYFYKIKTKNLKQKKSLNLELKNKSYVCLCLFMFFILYLSITPPPL